MKPLGIIMLFWIIIFLSLEGYSFFIINDKIIYFGISGLFLLWVPLINRLIMDYNVFNRIKEKYPEEFGEDYGINLRPKDLKVEL